jgi:hypothetical protein
VQNTEEPELLKNEIFIGGFPLDTSWVRFMIIAHPMQWELNKMKASSLDGTDLDGISVAGRVGYYPEIHFKYDIINRNIYNNSSPYMNATNRVKSFNLDCSNLNPELNTNPVMQFLKTN